MPLAPAPWRALLAVDLDGTLLRPDGTIAEEDAHALEVARRAGFGVVLATGRFPPSVVPLAERWGIRLPLVCVDGAIITRTSEIPERCFILRETWRLASWCSARGLKPFEFSQRRLFFRTHDADHVPLVAQWARGSTLEPERHAEAVVMMLALGTRELCARALAELVHLPHNANVDAFRLSPSECWTLRFRRVRTSKGAAVRRIARALAIPLERIAAVGNDYNDLSLFQAANRSFAMADAPDTVKCAATVRLSRGGHTGGGVAEAVHDLLRARQSG
jgi:Cof subfamily protein (haloacid dehalogenase superfamily)